MQIPEMSCMHVIWLVYIGVFTTLLLIIKPR